MSAIGSARDRTLILILCVAMIQRPAGMKRRPVGEADDISVAHSASCGLTRDNLKRAPAGRHNIGSTSAKIGGYVARIRGLFFLGRRYRQLALWATDMTPARRA